MQDPFQMMENMFGSNQPGGASGAGGFFNQIFAGAGGMQGEHGPHMFFQGGGMGGQQPQ